MEMVIATVKTLICYLTLLKIIGSTQDMTGPLAELVDTIKPVDTAVLCMSIPGVTGRGGSEAGCPAPVLELERQFCHAA